ncbi:hypothetical protein BGZ76_009351 [Entomortierella beljakovae]|nr:hypothetical protein BGZ76_009351 [Entomortierella beljakovae]
MSFFHKLKHVVHTEGTRGIRHALQKEGTKRLAQDLSANLDVNSLSFCETRRYGLPAHISSIAVDPVQGLLACGTFKGAIAVIGAFDVAAYLELSEAVSIKMMTFQPGSPVLIVVDAKNAITVFDLIKRQHIFIRNARNIVTCIELLPGSNWLFHGLKDGTIDVFDVYKGQSVAYRIPNILPEGKKHSLVLSIKAHPTDNNQILIAYNTGIVLWSIKNKSVLHTYIYEIPPGAIGGVSPVNGLYDINESRYPHVTVIAWRPDGHGFVSGYDDGCIVFWDIQKEKPVMARTVGEINVNVPGSKPVYDHENSKSMPIYQLSWCLQGNMSDTTLIISGGSSLPGIFGLNILDFPNKPDYRCPNRHHALPTESDVLDFVILPRDSPWYNGVLDPVSLLVLTNHGGIKSFSFDAGHTPETIPSSLLFVEPSLVIAKTYGHLPNDIYGRLVYGLNSGKMLSPPQRIPLHGVQLAQCDESKLCRDILVTAHSDLSVRFWEAASLRPLHHLTVELRHLFFENHGVIVFLEFSVDSQVLAVGFSNGNWVYCKLSLHQNVSRQSVDQNLAADFQRAVQVNQTATRNEPNETLDKHMPQQVLTSGSVQHAQDQQPPPPYNDQDQHPSHSVTQDKNLPPIPQCPQGQAAPTMNPDIQCMDDVHHSDKQSSQGHGDFGHPAPQSQEDPAAGNLLPESIPHRPVSPSLPPRPEFVEASLPNGSEFMTAFKSSSHMGKINQIAVSGCGLVAVSDELYSLSITDTVSRKVLHVEDLKIVMLDRDKDSPTLSDNHGDSRSIQSDARSIQSDSRSTFSDQRSVYSDGPSTYSDNRSSNLDSVSLHAQLEPNALQRVGVVITSLEFVSATTNEQDKIPSLLLIAGSSDGIYMIFSITEADDQSSYSTPRQVRKVETFQTRECYPSIHTSIINVISQTDHLLASPQPNSGALSQPSTGHQDVPSPTLQPIDETNHPPSHRSSISEESSAASSTSHKPSIYNAFKNVQGKALSKANQRLQYLIAVSNFSLRVHMNCTSRRIHKVDLTHPSENEQQGAGGIASRTGRIMAANVIHHGGASCILCLTESGRILLFSIPKLELIPLPVPGGELFLPIVLEPERLRECIIHSDGRIFVPILKYEFRMYSLWGHDRWVQTPRGFTQERSADSPYYIKLYNHNIRVPPKPQVPTSPTTVASWFGLGSGQQEATSQHELDEVLGGPSYRPENPVLRRAGFEEHFHDSHGNSYGDSTTVSSGISAVLGDTLQGLDERGKKLQDLSNKSSDAAAAAERFRAAAKALNDKNANKKWYEF